MESILNSKTSSFMQADALDQIKHKIWSPIPRKLRKIEDEHAVIRGVVVQNNQETASSPFQTKPLFKTFNPNNSAFRSLFGKKNKLEVLNLSPSRSPSPFSDKSFTLNGENSDKSLQLDFPSSAFHRTIHKISANSAEQTLVFGKPGQPETPKFRINVNSLKEISLNTNKSASVPDFTKKAQDTTNKDSFLPKGYAQLFNYICNSVSACGTPSDEKEENSKPHHCERHAHSENGNEKILNFLKPNLSKKKTRHCNCKNSKCLKLYCECLAHGEYCDDQCNCCDCHNNVAKEEVRSYALSLIVEKKPELLEGGEALAKQKRSKIVRGKGCNCKKSACLKKYCECFNSGGGCGPHCKCEGCKNPFTKSETGNSFKNTADTGSPISPETTHGLGLSFKEMTYSDKPLSELDSNKNRHIETSGLPLLSRAFSEKPHGSLSIFSLLSFENKL